MYSSSLKQCFPYTSFSCILYPAVFFSISSLLEDILLKTSIGISHCSLTYAAWICQSIFWVPHVHVIAFELKGRLQMLKFHCDTSFCFRIHSGFFCKTIRSHLVELQENIISYFPSVCLCSLLSVPLHLPSSASASIHPPLGLSSECSLLFFHQGYERAGGKKGRNRWIKRGDKMKREWDTALSQCHWQRALRKGIKLWATAGALRFESCFLAFLSPFSSTEYVWLYLLARLCYIFHSILPFSSTAPHEICKDENLLSMSWKRASVGETVYNKCPTNVIGQWHIIQEITVCSSWLCAIHFDGTFW